MTEKLLQFIWQFGYYNNASLTTIDGEALTILFPGSFNKNQGPDFTAARIKIGNTTLAGNIELHLTTSDWKRHNHETDNNYRNVILHVVFQHDQTVNNIPVLELGSRISNLLLQRYALLMENATFLPCGNSLSSVNNLVLAAWKERLLVERLTRKAGQVMECLTQSNNHWEETFWWLLARAFGAKLNSDAFETLARSIPVNVLSKHKHSIHQLEALLLGQANLLTGEFDDEYPKLLQREYNFLKKKYNLQSSPIPVLFLRMRPGNFPTIRLAQLAMLVHQTTHLFSKILETKKPGDLKSFFDVTANDFWHYHYTFQQASAFKKKALGAEMTSNIIINTVIPVLFAYGLFHRDESYKDKALQWLEELSPENNHITTGFVKIGVENKSAYDSQALLELKNEYCGEKRCLDCSIGNAILREAAQEYKTVSRSIPV
ncbi:MAG TPA: DUF2851 family protein [Flavisolibacter sp.]|nr:DUF2851 family protein [Flavisolibacter sp.]